MVEFNDQKLRAALEQFGPSIEGYDGRLDAISADIKQLEQYLTGKVRLPVVYGFAGGMTRCPALDDQEGEKVFIGGEYAEGDLERVAFECVEGRWRITYKRVTTEGHLDPETAQPVWTSEEVVEHRPLIEAKAEVRIRAAKALPELMRVVAESLVADPSELYGEPPLLSADEVPF